MASRKPWAVLAYMVAEDPEHGVPLDPIATDEKNRLLALADRHAAQMHVAVQVDFSETDGVLRQLAGHAPERRAETIASDPRVLTEFMNWAIDNCPAERYLLLFWGHSFGTAGLFPDGTPGNTTLEERLSLSDLAYAVRYAGSKIGVDRGDSKVDILLFKNCCMSTLETAYELQGAASYMIASQGLVPVKDGPYVRLVDVLDSRPTESSAAGILGELGRFYEDPKNRGDQDEVPYSLVNINRARAIGEPLGKLVKKLIAARRRQNSASRDALFEASHDSPGDAALLDLGIMCSNLEEVGEPLALAASDVDRAVRQMVVDHRPVTDLLLHGLSIFYFPADPSVRAKSIVAPLVFAGDYQRLRLCLATEWDRIACERIPGFELLSQSGLSERSGTMGDRDGKGINFGQLTNASKQVLSDIRSLQQFVGRLTTAVTQSNDPANALENFESRQGIGIRAFATDLQSTVSNLRANMDVLESTIEGGLPEESKRYDRRAADSQPKRREPADTSIAHRRDMRLGELTVHIP
jgi:hypothetical protein